MTAKPTGVWLREGNLVYRLADTPHGISNCDEITVGQAGGSRITAARAKRADDIVTALQAVERAKAWQPSHDGIRDARAAEPPDGEWRGFAAECAQQYGAEYLDDDAKLVVITEENLVNMMAALGYPTRRSAPQVGRPCPAPTHRPQLVSPDEGTIVEAMEFSCSQRPSVDDDSYVLGILKIFLDAAHPPSAERSCCNDECGWQGAESEAVHPKHDSAALLCPQCHETTEQAPQGETNVRLGTDSNPPAPGQQRGMAGSVALGQSVGRRPDPEAGHPSAQGDELLTVAARNIRSFLRSAAFKCEIDRQAALNCVEVLCDRAVATPPRVERFALIGDPGAECVRNGHGYWELHRDGKLVCPLSPTTRQFVESALAARSRA